MDKEPGIYHVTTDDTFRIFDGEKLVAEIDIGEFIFNFERQWVELKVKKINE